MKPLIVFLLALAAFGAVAHLAIAAEAATAQPAAAPQPAPLPEAQLRRNLHDIRVMLENEYAQEDAAARGSNAGLIVNPADSPSIGALRQQLTQSMERLEDRCFGLDVKVKDGNAIVICGNNNGTADNTNVRSQTDNNLYQPAPSIPAEPPVATEPAPEGDGT